jgi:hypothetical protein
MKTQKPAGKWSMSQRLQFAAFMVAGPRYLALGAMALGHQPEDVIIFFLILEVASWLGFAMLEGYAIPYIAKGIRRFTVRSFEWYQLQVYRALLLLAIPALGAPLYLAISLDQTMVVTLGTFGFVVWAFLLTGVGALVIDAVGTCESVNEPEEAGEEQRIAIRRGNLERIGIVDRAAFVAKYYHEATPDELVTLFEDEYGEALTLAEAETALAAAGRKNGRK